MLNSEQIRATALGILALGCFAPTAKGLDLYILYSGTSKKEKETMVKSLPEDISKKSYNVDLLAFADYSGKQKAALKFQRANIIMVLGDLSMRPLKGIKVTEDLLIIKSVKRSISSTKWVLYILPKGTDISTLGKNAKTLDVEKTEDLEDVKKIRSFRAILVDECAIGIYQASVKVLQQLKSEKSEKKS